MAAYLKHQLKVKKRPKISETKNPIGIKVNFFLPSLNNKLERASHIKFPLLYYFFHKNMKFFFFLICGFNNGGYY